MFFNNNNDNRIGKKRSLFDIVETEVWHSMEFKRKGNKKQHLKT